MNPAACIVAVDVGNTAVKLAVQRHDSMGQPAVARNPIAECFVIDHSILIHQTHWEQLAIQWVRDQLGCKQMQWRIASVHRRAASRLVDAIRQASPSATIDLVAFGDVPMRVAVDDPGRLGIDRLLSAYAAGRWLKERRLGERKVKRHAPDPGGPMVVVDAGSAVTIDWVDAVGTFCGGVILPGLALQSSVLATGTDALPQIDWAESRSVHLPATNTADAIYAGILVGVAAAIDGFVDRYLEVWKRESGSIETMDHVELVLTGGDSAALSAHVRHPHLQTPNLVCRGLLDLVTGGR